MKIIGIIAAVVLLFSLIAWAAEATRSVPVGDDSPPWTQQFLDEYADRHGVPDEQTTTMLLAGINATCGDLTAKRNLPQAWRMNVDHGMSSDQAATVIELAVQYYCPQFTYLYKE